MNLDEWRENWTADQLAGYFQIEVRTVYKIAKRHNLQYQRRKVGAKKRLIPATRNYKHRRILDLYNSGQIRIATISRQLGYPYHMVYRIVTRYREHVAQVASTPKARVQRHIDDVASGNMVGHTHEDVAECACCAKIDVMGVT